MATFECTTVNVAIDSISGIFSDNTKILAIFIAILL